MRLNFKRRGKAVLNDPKRESLRWWQGIQAVEARLDRPRHALHVIDVAGDMFELLQQLVAHDIRFVVRVAYPNRIVDADDGAPTELRALVDKAKPRRQRRTVELSSRGEERPRETKRKLLPEARERPS